ncbi:hypothetical protein PIB30_049245 [Stylosanthes scabra]|uniref:Uncharacterized protein n=1 Tax=Stylosanthes scabra TaxID=79078 RepID=A0ABU6SHI2_9FABA|nr:hypothetical protein [Stylosanthes scabra]
MISKGFQRLSDDDWSGYISCMLIPLFYKLRTVNLGIKRGRKGYRLGLWQQRTIGSSKCMWGSCFHVGQELTSRLTVAAGGPSANVPATNLHVESSAACLGGLEVSVCGLEFGVVGEPKLRSASKLIKHVRDLAYSPPYGQHLSLVWHQPRIKYNIPN